MSELALLPGSGFSLEFSLEFILGNKMALLPGSGFSLEATWSFTWNFSLVLS